MPIKLPTVQTGYERSVQEAAKKVGKNLRINMGSGAKSVEGLTRPLGRLTGKADEFTKSMEAANARVLAFGASVGVIAAVSNALKQLVTTSIEVEKSLTNINSILKQSESQLDGFKNQIFDIARNTGQTFDTVAEAALELSRQGLTAEQVTKRLNDSLILARLSGLSAADSVAGLTAAVNSFSKAGLTTTDVLNKISAAAASAAVSDRDLIEGLKRSGAVAVASGVKFDELIGIISALQEKTARGGAVIGNSLKTIFTRIQDLDRLTTLQDLGVQVTDLEGKVLSSNKVIENLAPVFAKLDQSSKVNLADKLVGKFQIAPFLALLEDYNQKVSRSGEVAATSFNATNEAYKRNEVLNTALAAAINTATVNLKELANALGEIGVTENLSKIIGVFNDIASNITKVLDGDGMGSKFAKGLIKGISAVIAGPGLALALLAIGKLLLDFAKFGTKALSTFFGLNKAAEAQKNLQGQIAASLLNDKGIRSAILSIEKQNISEGEKKKLQTQFFTKALNEQLMVMQKMQGIARTIAPGVMAGTASRRGGRAAGGFLPVGAERSDISRGVGGAPASAKPVVIPNFAFGGGKRGTMVANSSEYIVPNYANGGDAIFNQNMASSMGLPSNAKKVRAAGGYIPNFAIGPAGALRGAGVTNMTQFRGLSGTGKTRDINGVKVTEAQAKNVFSRQRPLSSSVIIPAQRYGVASVFPDKKTGDSSTNPTQLRSNLAQAAAAQGIKNIQFKGIQIRSIHDAKQNLKQKKNEFKNQIADLFVNPVAQLGANVIGASFQGNDKADLKSEINKVKKGGGGVNLFSSSVEGGIFEAAIRLITKKSAAIKAFKQEKDDQMPFDFEEGSRTPNREFKNTFGFSSILSKADAKRTASNDAVRTVIAKAFNSPDQRQFLISQIKKTNPSFNPALTVKKAASGYIPNFAEGALEEAVGREKAAGLPVSQIRINQSGKLRNSQNPMGLAVTNTRDEPTGAIPAARGFIPNFSKSKDGGAFSNAGMNAMMLASSLAFLVGSLSDGKEAQDEANKSLFGLTDALQIAMTALMAHATLTMLNVKGMGAGLQSKGNKMTLAGFGTTEKGLAKGGAKGGILKAGGKLTRIFGGLVSGIGRFLPMIGPLIMGFTIISGIMKKFGVDLKGVGSMLGNALKKTANLLMDGASMAFKAITIFARGVLTLLSKMPIVGGLGQKGLDGLNFVQGKIDGARFETDTFAESLKKAQQATTERSAGEKANQQAEDIKKKEEEIKKINEQIKSIKLSTAKQELDSQLKLAKLELTRKGQAEIQFDRAKKLNNVTFERLQQLEKIAELEKFNAKTGSLLLDPVIQSVQDIEGIDVDPRQQAAVQKEISEAIKDGNISRKEALDMAKKITKISNQNSALNSTIATKIEGTVDALMKQRDLEKDINMESLDRRQGLEKELELRKEIERSLKSQQEAISLAAKEGGKFRTSVADVEMQRLTGLKRGATEGSKSILDVDIARQQRVKTRESGQQALMNLQNEKDSIAGRYSQSAKLGLSKDELFKMRERDAELDTLIRIQKDQNKSALDVVNAQIELAEKGRVLSTSFVKLVNEFDNFSISQKIEDAKFRSITGDTRKARTLARFEQKDLLEAGKLGTAEERAKFLRDAPLKRTISERRELNKLSDLEINSKFKDGLISASETFKENFVSAFAEGIKSVDDLEDALLNAADQFLKAMTTNFIDKFMNQAMSGGSGGEGSGGEGSGGGGILKKIFGSIGSFFGFADGGKVRGGSGSRDDVPAMLMGGEFVMNKKAVQRYGSGFMEAINSGSVRGFARGGQVRDEEGMFTTPGMNGAGAIVGMKDLMSFATQTPVALGRDKLRSEGAFLDAESGRMTMFGRRNNPQFQKVQDAKRQALGLAAQESEAHEQAKEQEVSLGKMLASAAISTIVSFGATKLGMAAGLGEGVSGLIGSGLGNFAGTKITGAPASGGAFGAAGATGDLMGIFSDKPKANPNQTVIKDAIPVSAPSAANPSSKPGFFSGLFSKAGDFFRGSGAGLPSVKSAHHSDGKPSMLPQPSAEDMLRLFPNTGVGGFPVNRATGGLIPAAGGVDTVPAMLSGGEFVMNAAATKNIGAGNLQSLNSGAGTGDNTDLVAKLDQLITATETSQSTGDINITINGSNGTESQTGGEDAPERERKLSERIKVAVKQVIADEQRLGGQLRK